MDSNKLEYQPRINENTGLHHIEKGEEQVQYRSVSILLIQDSYL